MNKTQDALAALLSCLGFDAMAEAAKTEDDPALLGRYARIVVQNLKGKQQRRVASALRALGLRWKRIAP